MSDFIPKSYKKEQTTIRIDAEKMKKIDELANSFNLSRSEFINQCIDLPIVISITQGFTSIPKAKS